MTFRRQLASAFIAWHLLAITYASLPSQAPVVRKQPSGTTGAWALATADAVGRFVSSAAGTLRAGLALALDRPVTRYLAALNLEQLWAMFSNPPTFDRYWRVRYYVRRPNGRLWMATELVGPAHREDLVRGLQSFRDSYTDKALEIAYNEFTARRRPEAIAPGTRPHQLPDALTPLGRYFARRFGAQRLRETGEQIVRVELWVGTAPNKTPGQVRDDARAAQRHAALLAYAEGPLESVLNLAPYPPYHGVEREADIEWVLEYFEEP